MRLMNGQWLFLRVWVACLAVIALSGCADGDSFQKREVAEPGTSPLVGSVTISLSTPPAVKPLSPVITTTNSIFLGAGATVVSGQTIALGASGGGLRAEPDGVLNETWVRGLADLGDRVLVRGTLHALSKKYGNGITPPPPFDGSPAFEPLNTVSWSVRYPTSGTGPVVIADPPPNPPLAPLVAGQYGDLTVNSQASLTITSGTYYLRTLKFESQSSVKLDQAKGPIILYVETGQIALRGSITSLTGDAPDLLIVYLGTTAFSVETLFNGALIAPSAAVTLRAVTGTHTGFFYSKDFQVLDAHARVQYRAPLSIVTASTGGGTPGGGSGTGGVGPGTNPGMSCAALIRALVPPEAVEAALSRYCGECASTVDTDRDKTQDCLDGCPYDPAKTEPGICGCGVSDADNEDNDPFPDCIDQCPKDPNNIAPGQCGCVGSKSLQPNGTRCTDTAGPEANATCNSGVCGNPPGSQPAPGCRFITWRSSGYWLCPPPGTGGGGGTGGAGGAGGTGGRGGTGGGGTGGRGGTGGGGGTAGAGGTGGGSTPRTQDEARLVCGAKGLSLLRIDSQQENDFFQDLFNQPIWIGANSVTTANNWRWANATTNNGDPFWTGGPTGSRVASRFSNWLEGSPTSTNRCTVMLPDTGLWQTVPCNQARGYICEHRTPPVRGPRRPPGMPNQPPTSNKLCISEALAQLPYAGPNGENAGPAYDALKAQVDALKDNPSGGRAGTAFGDLSAQQVGPCLNDPLANGVARGEARDEGRAGCKFQAHPSLTSCMTNAECSGFGSNFVCRSINQSEDCSPETDICEGRTVCGTLDCSDPDAYSPEPPCTQVEICGQAGSEQTTDLEPAETPAPQDFNTRALFGGALPNAGPSAKIWGGPGATDADPPHGPDGTQTGTNHAWCTDKPRAPASGETPPPDAGDGKSGKTNTSKIKFGFRPDLEFRANPGIIAQGETNLEIFAGASLAADVALDDFLGQSFATNIFDASIGLGLQRCHIKSTFAVNLFGKTFADPSILGLPNIDSTREELDPDLYEVATKCDEAVARFQFYADRAKKAFRDAQQLLTQYKSASKLGQALQGNLCNAAFVFGSIDDDFPGGPDCAVNEPPYVTVGRFLEYYQAPGAGQIAKLHLAMQSLHDATAAIKDIIPAIDLGFTGLSRQESETILSVQFFIGPIPMVLEVDVFARYGIGGGFELVFKVPTGLVTGEKGLQPVANVSARVVPYAGAGLSAFVGVGISLGPLKASIGIEGALTLANISAPIFAGVGLKVEALKEKRVIHSDILDVAMGPDSFHFGAPTALKFYMTYEYGAGVDLLDILSGEISGTLKIKFFWFSRKWRKRIVKFTGFNHHFNLVRGSDEFSSFSVGERVPAVLPTSDGSPDTEGTTTDVASGGPGLGVAETQAPLMILAPPAPPPAETPTETVPFNSSAVDSLEYDSLCCAHASEDCQPGTAGRPQCCPGFACVVEVPGSGGVPPVAKCQPECNKAGAACDAYGNGCCGDLVCGSLGLCQQCGSIGNDCATNEECCSGICDEDTGTCKSNPCEGEGAPSCNGTGQACDTCGKPCCEGQICSPSGTCQPDPCGGSSCTPLGVTCGTCGAACCGISTGCVDDICVNCNTLSCTVATSGHSSECCNGYRCNGSQCVRIIVVE